MGERRQAETVPEKDWKKAYALIDEGTNVSEVARQLCLPYATLNRRYAERRDGVSKRGPKPMMGLSGEEELVKWLLMHESIGKCVSIDMFREMGKRIAGSLGIDGFTAGKDWEERFFKRHPRLSKRKGELTERNRLYAIHPLRVEEYFAAIKPHITKRIKNLNLIWAMDEWGFDMMNLGASGYKVLLVVGFAAHHPFYLCALHQPNNCIPFFCIFMLPHCR